MPLNPLAGKPATHDMLINVPRLISAFYNHHPEPANPAHQVSFGTSGHRGSSTKKSFNKLHVRAISQAICEYRKQEHIDGPLFLGLDTHALSESALETAIEVFAGNDVDFRVQEGLGYTPTPVISHAILTYNRDRTSHLADGVIITPSHNPPGDGGLKYNPPTGGPAGTHTTREIQTKANLIMRLGAKAIERVQFEPALEGERGRKVKTTRSYDYITPYVDDLVNVIDMDAIAAEGIRIGVDPLGGASLAYWEPIAERYGLKLEVVNRTIDPTFSFMTVDKDGKIRMDCSSPYAMAGLIGLKDRFDIAFGNDPDADRHGIVTPSVGLMNPNHYLAVAVWYLFQNRPGWRSDAYIGKTLVSSSMIDRVAEHLNRPLAEVPVGFKYFVDGLMTGTFGFGGEESAGASFLRKDGTVWTTDKDGIILNLLAAEITAKTGRDPGELYKELEKQFGNPVYERMDAPATPAEKDALSKLSPDMIKETEMAGEPIRDTLTRSPYKHFDIGGLKVVTKNGWFAARPSGTEDIYKIYAESFKGIEHLRQIQLEAQEIVSAALDVLETEPPDPDD